MCSHAETYTQCRISFCYTCGLVYAGATQGELPERAREGPLEDNSVAQLFGLVATDGTYELNLSTDFTVGCDDLGAPYLNRLLIAKT